MKLHERAAFAAWKPIHCRSRRSFSGAKGTSGPRSFVSHGPHDQDERISGDIREDDCELGQRETSTMELWGRAGTAADKLPSVGFPLAVTTWAVMSELNSLIVRQDK